MFVVAQITDLHITTDQDPVNKARNEARLRRVLEQIEAFQPKPIAILATGDLVDRGEPEEYEELKAIFKDVKIPIYAGVGNHDLRKPMLAAFEPPFVGVDPNGFVQYAFTLEGVRIVMVDTLDEGAHGGAFCKKRAAWLKKTLNADRKTPTIVALHHPPIPSGIQWMTPDPKEDWIVRLQQTLKGHKQVRGIICGHMHRAFHRMFGEHVVSVAPATSIQLTLNLSEVDMRKPDGREILNEEPAGFAIHHFDQGELTTHIALEKFPSAVTYTVPFIKD